MAQDPEIQEILLRVDLVDLIGTRVKLTRSGKSFKGLCPFHPEKTPSFHVYPTDGVKPGFFHCYGCHKGGDALTFLTNREGLSFPEALEQLAGKVGIELRRRPEISGKQRRNRLAVMDQCQSHYRSNLKHAQRGEKARDYLKKRSVDENLCDRFGLGYALSEWEGLSRLLQKNAENLQIALEQGLIKRSENRSGYFDFFRDRLMFPIYGASGQLVAFAGRDLSGDSSAKYMNSSETDLFRKGQILYGLHLAKEKIRKTKRAILVEGYFDVTRMHACGFEETVAPMGTAVTPEQLALLERLAEEVVFLFDGDSAGVTAALRSLEQTWNLKIGVRVVHLPQGVDPDEYLLDHSQEEMESLLQSGRPGFAYLLERATEGAAVQTPEGIRRVVERVFESLSKIESRILLDLRLKETANRIGTSYESLKQDWVRYRGNQRTREGPGRERPGVPPPGGERPDDSPVEKAKKGLLALILLPENRLEKAMGRTFAEHPTARKFLKDALGSLEANRTAEVLLPVIQAYLNGGRDAAHQIWTKQENDARRWELEAELREERIPENPLRTLRDYTHTLKRSEIESRIAFRRNKLAVAEESQNWEDIGRLATEIDELVKERETILSERTEEVG